MQIMWPGAKREEISGEKQKGKIIGSLSYLSFPNLLFFLPSLPFGRLPRRPVSRDYKGQIHDADSEKKSAGKELNVTTGSSFTVLSLVNKVFRSACFVVTVVMLTFLNVPIAREPSMQSLHVNDLL